MCSLDSTYLVIETRAQQIFSVSVLSFEGHQNYCPSRKVALDTLQVNEPGCVPVAYYLQALNLNFIAALLCHGNSIFHSLLPEE